MRVLPVSTLLSATCCGLALADIMCAKGDGRGSRGASAKANELVPEITEQSADGRRFDRRLTLEKQQAVAGGAPGKSFEAEKRDIEEAI